MKANILVIGSSNTDMIARVPRLPRPGETILGGSFLSAGGGKGANQALAARRAGGKVSFVACIGRDMFGDRATADFKRAGLNVRYLRRTRGTSGVALIFVANDGQNTIAVTPGANAQLSPADIIRARPAFRSADLLLLQLESPLATVKAALKEGLKWKLPIILNPAPAQKLPDSMLRQVSVLTPNETESEWLTGIKVTGISAARRAAESLHRRGVTTVVITLGSRGALVSSGKTQELVPGFKVKTLDTTAAGDVFNGALAVGLGEGLGLISAVRFANAAAAVSVTRIGAQPSIPGRREINDLLLRHGV